MATSQRNKFPRTVSTYQKLLKRFKQEGHLKKNQATAEQFVNHVKELYTEEWLSQFVGKPTFCEVATAIIEADLELMLPDYKETIKDDNQVIPSSNGHTTPVSYSTDGVLSPEELDAAFGLEVENWEVREDEDD